MNGSPFDAAAAVARVHSPEKFVVVVKAPARSSTIEWVHVR